MATAEIEAAIATIQSNASLLDKDPQVSNKGTAELKAYFKPPTIQFRLPLARPAQGTSGLSPPYSAREITTALFADGSWTVEKKTPFQPSNDQKWLFYQTAGNLRLMSARYSPESKNWSLQPVQVEEEYKQDDKPMKRMANIFPIVGSALGAVAVLGTTSEKLMLVYQGNDLRTYTLMHENDTWTQAQRPLGDKRIPLQSNLSLYVEGTGNIGLAVNSDMNDIRVVSWSKDKQTWSEATVVAESFKGIEITVASWNSGKLFLFTQAPQSPDINQFSWSGDNWSTPIPVSGHDQ
ncbi:hypothetical protein ASPACDRAFT_40641 [Aspergillus aculeatus ATCC 16872]|uniref:Uncharacterized protein n=1 Tax=Aspergillus aculeatus (strain ATCC 16872 / CBS 172.66 / WB 5094) TaxID=690307 RepID=A0A1L9X0M1_ASPA1|nr:uncharacterized protein ASPACDRAFT_40641 [Aspergillus aculeatus ATCC 16872]OJK01829.1 hypothetical protein ASPACDRAFT_40641 [Aspergillus aculeatus ATCC 16872]